MVKNISENIYGLHSICLGLTSKCFELENDDLELKKKNWPENANFKS